MKTWRPDELIPTRSSLLSRLKDWDDQDSWRDFFETYWRLIYSVAVKAGLGDAEAQDVVQETILTIAKGMHEHKRDPALGSFKGWLLHTTRWRIADAFRKRSVAAAAQPARDDATERTPTAERIADPNASNWEMLWDEEYKQNLFDAALDRVKRRASPKDYQLFDLVALKGWPVAEITATLGVSVHQVYAAKSRIGKLLKREVRYLETKIF